MSESIITEIKRQFVGQHCFLEIDGREYDARICGRLNKFATVGPLNSGIPPVEFTWFVVNRIMRTTKLFRS
jgi:hypothetical protein